MEVDHTAKGATLACIGNPKPKKVAEVEKNVKETFVACKQNPIQGNKHKISVFGLEDKIVASDIKDIQEKLKKSTYERVAFLCKRVKETLDNSEKYTEFLRKFQMYARGVVDATEFLNLVDDSIQADQTLMHEFEEFLEHYDKVEALVSLNCGLGVGQRDVIRID